MHKEIVSFEGVHFRRDGRVILDQVDWKIHQGENWALLGLNGSGKSTLLSMLPAYTYPTKGEVAVFGKTFGKYQWEKIRKRLGFLSSTLERFDRTLATQTVFEIILSGKFASIGIYDALTDEDKAQARGLIDQFELNKIADGYFFKLSQGEKRRTLIARAFMAKPDLMVLDEPCQSLDLRAKERLLRNLQSANDTNQFPFVYVTHQIDEILPSVSHVAILDEGRIQFSGPKHEVLTEANLTALYGLPLRLEWEGDRPWIIIK